MNHLGLLGTVLTLLALGSGRDGYAAPAPAPALAHDPALEWPPVTRECRPWSYWWWLGSAVDSTNLTRELQRYRDAGWGGVHIIPIYGAQGWEARALEYLSPAWMAMLRHAVTEAERGGLGVDMTTGTGWCFGGPEVTELEANALVVPRMVDLEPGARLEAKFDRRTTQTLVAFGPDGRAVPLTQRIGEDGTVDWTAEGGRWRVVAIAQRPSGQKVKRAAPGGAGHMLNLFYGAGMAHYLARFTDAFAAYDGPRPRAMYHDSYEYNSNWAPDLFEEFARRRGYRLEPELPALLDRDTSERAARVHGDYRETLSDLLIEQTLLQWVQWCRERGILTRNQAHGSPGNLLDLYALADIPETEMFHLDRNRLVSKLASSAAHVAGRRLIAAETGTWLAEHFTETLAELKHLADDLFLSGVNHVFYHGTCYSPDEAPWPGWLFYASTQMNPRNSIWRDVPALNAYLTRCQAVLQAGAPDHDLLLYWPLHEFWHQPAGLEQRLTVHARGWFEDQPFGQAAARLWDRGFSFDYLSDRQLATARATPDGVTVPGGHYQAVVLPRCRLLPLETLERLLALARAGATVVVEHALPQDVPGWGDLDRRRAQFHALLETVKGGATDHPAVRAAPLGSGRLLVGELEPALALAGIAREPLVDHPGLMYLRRSAEGGRHYFIAQRGAAAFDGWLPLAAAARRVVVLDPLSGRAGYAATRKGQAGTTEVRLQLPPGGSVILRTRHAPGRPGPAWPIWQTLGPAQALVGTWDVEFLDGGPARPAPFRTTQLGSWTDRDDPEAQRFAGTARYALTFDAPVGAARSWMLDLGQVCQSARVRLNGRDLGTCFTSPFRVALPDLEPVANRLEVEVTNVAANRIRDLDRRQVAWRTFHDINFVNLAYKPFDASTWPLTASGLLGPVTLQAVRPEAGSGDGN